MGRLLITGAEGFIGRALTRALRGSGGDFTAVGRGAGDISDASTWAAMPAADIVIHLAGKTIGRGTWDNPGEFFRSNVVGTVEALRYCTDRGARLVYLSSYLYGTPPVLPVPETAPIVATNPYSLSKKEAEEACRFFAESGLEVTVLRPFNLYGPGQREDFLIPSIISQARRGDSIVVADQKARRDYVFIDDLVDAITRAAATPLGGFRVLNIGTGLSHSVGDIVAILQHLMGRTFSISNTGQASNIVDCRADRSAAAQALGWSPHFTLQEGLKRMLAP